MVCPRFGDVFCLAALVVVLGCAKEPYVGRVQPYGDRLIVTYGSMWGSGEAIGASIRDANRYCEERGLQMQPESQDRGTLIFRCVSPTTQ